jgi:hypothetical protein
VVKEGRISLLVSGYGRITLFPMTYDKKSSFVDKRAEISNFDFIRNMESIIIVVDISHILSDPIYET